MRVQSFELGSLGFEKTQDAIQEKVILNRSGGYLKRM